VLAIALAALVLIPAAAEAQFFGRNKIQYENFDWRVLNTPDFQIFFYPEEEELAARAALIAEDAYLRLSRIFDHELETQVPFILYASPNDFQQTNISDGLIGEGTGGFSEPLRKRMVLPYPGDTEGFVHVINHELVHVFMFDIAYRSYKADSGRRRWFPVPLWFAEGMAEWFSSEWDNNADMWMRDATIYDWVIPLDRIYGGYQVYKEGQSAMRYIAATYGEDKVVELFKAMERNASVDRALEQTIGLDTKGLSDEWMKALKREYWPLYSDKQEPGQYARRMTDHWEEQAYFFQQPSISPDGRFIAFFSDYEGLVDLFVMDAIDGVVLRKLITGYRSDRFLSLHSFDSSIGFSPDSKTIAFVAKSGRDEHLFVVRLDDGEILHDIGLEMDIARSPAWAPDGKRVVLSGNRGGQTDLYEVVVETGQIRQLTDDFVDEHNPVWHPDGRRVVYSARAEATEEISFIRTEGGSLRLQEVDFAQRNVRPERTGYDILSLDLISEQRETIVSTGGADRDPFIVDEDNMVFVSDLTGASNLFVYRFDTGEVRRLSDVLGGIFHPSISTEADRLVFTAFTRAGFDIFLLENFSEKAERANHPMVVEGTSVPLRMMQYSEPTATGPLDEGNVTGTIPNVVVRRGAVAGAAEPDGGAESSTGRGVQSSEETTEAAPGPEPQASTAPPPRGGTRPDTEDAVDLGQADAEPEDTTPPGAAQGRTVGTVEKYRLRFSLDPVGSSGGGIYYTSGTGLGLANILTMSDLLGNHRMQFLVNFYGSLEDSDLSFSYYYLKRRVNLAAGIFHYRNFLNSNFNSIGEIYDNSRLFTERNYGVFGLISYPFSQFSRLDLELQAYVSDKTFFEQDPFTLLVFETGRQEDHLIQPTVSWVHDSSFWGQTGPVTGSRYVFSVAPAIPITEDSLNRTTIFGDYRKYFRLWGRNSIAIKTVAATSQGENPRSFVVGGPFTLRGWDTWDFDRQYLNGDPVYPNLVGSNLLLASVEYRLPVIDALIFGWPGRWGVGGITGVTFFDIGTAKNGSIQFFEGDPPGLLKLADLNADIGFGIRLPFAGLPLRFEWAWKTDLSRISNQHQFHFTIAPSF
jgi:Tol biopolymer transport system component